MSFDRSRDKIYPFFAACFFLSAAAGLAAGALAVAAAVVDAVVVGFVGFADVRTEFKAMKTTIAKSTNELECIFQRRHLDRIWKRNREMSLWRCRDISISERQRTFSIGWYSLNRDIARERALGIARRNVVHALRRSFSLECDLVSSSAETEGERERERSSTR